MKVILNLTTGKSECKTLVDDMASVGEFPVISKKL